ncbi:MAG: nicotinamide mononucleotide transporter [Clostridia bacterium]|nr:nicotinamide mononucleotide transporter [Clostridia bacterium]
MKIKNPFKQLTKFELILWVISLLVVTASFLSIPQKDYLTLSASLIGVTALIFVAKGLVFGQALTVIFSVFYGIISFHFQYYGEVITYLCMTTPMAIFAMVSWMRHPYKDSNVVEVSRLTKKKIALMTVITAVVTFVFYFVLRALNKQNLLISTLSVTTSFIAVYLTFLRSPYYAIGYSANDIVLIILWILATIENLSYLPMIICFVMFLANDIYGFINWQRLKSIQAKK